MVDWLSLLTVWLAVFRRCSASLLPKIQMELSSSCPHGYLVILCCLVALYQELGERGNEMENSEYQRRKADDLQKRLVDAHSSIHHIELVRTSILCLCLWCYEMNHIGISNLQNIDCQIPMHSSVSFLYIFVADWKGQAWSSATAWTWHETCSCRPIHEGQSWHSGICGIVNPISCSFVFKASWFRYW